MDNNKTIQRVTFLNQHAYHAIVKGVLVWLEASYLQVAEGKKSDAELYDLLASFAQCSDLSLNRLAKNNQGLCIGFYTHRYHGTFVAFNLKVPKTLFNAQYNAEHNDAVANMEKAHA